MKIVGVEGMTADALSTEVQRGGKFVYFTYCVSIVILTFKQPSSIYFVRADESGIVKGLGFTLISLFFGWWGIPWGPIYTIQSLYNNLNGGYDVTYDVMREIMPRN